MSHDVPPPPAPGPPFPSPMAPDPPPTSRSRLVLLLLVVVLVGMGGVGIAAAFDRLDSALLFVGVPCLLAFLVGTVRGRGGWGSLFQTLTVVLLLASALLQEAAVCVLLAAPFVYGVAALVYGIVVAQRRPTGSFALAPVLLVVLVEGVLPGTRIHPEQSSAAERVVATDCATFESALLRGPRIDPEADRGALLRVFPYPTPTAASGRGLEVGDGWELTVAGGTVRTRVVERASGHLRFAVVDDTSRLGRWVGVRAGSLDWQESGDRCTATMQVDYERRLDPALWFGPVSDVFMHAGVDAFLAGLD
ncbi:hypothetical protein JQN72_01050 [Phycicoccus sp. CSK15P-2]|uniref:hypothetical protein n=1 Tax=Phycicoccus sp. CSK15P-2 TaxID=2807627 RepID=UPI00195103B9|nr:hypothetical protein [Phycicoccus sp. CSK15P-2]MBM6402832.1 hypothetical protein [Phycicoccus sp. CSK15P-2]